MRRVIINGDFLAFDTFAGVSRFAMELLSELDQFVESMSVEVLTPQYAQVSHCYKNIIITKFGRAPLVWWKQITLPRYVKKRDGILLDLSQGFPLCSKAITCIHDCIPELVPSAYSGFFGTVIKKPLKLLQRRVVVNNSVKLLTVSNYSKEDIIRLFGVDEGKVQVVPNAWQHLCRVPYDYSILNRLSLSKGSYYFSLGSRVPHKNIDWIIAAAKQDSNTKYIVSGENRFKKGFEKTDFPNNVVFTGYISDGEIRALMANCKAFVFPSLYEGFGIPPLEALSEGAEIIISNIDCFHEIYDSSAHYIDPQKYDGIDLIRVLSSKVSSPKEVLDKYSWEKSARILCEVLKDTMVLE